MKGLLKNNIYATLSGAKILSIVMVLVGIFLALVISPPLLTTFTVMGIISYSAFAVSVVKEEFTSKWEKYKLTLPVMRSEIIKSQFLNQLLWTAVGTLLPAAVTTLSWFLHGCPFDSPFDIVTTFVLGISLSLFMGAVYFPLFHLFFHTLGADRGDFFMGLCLGCAFIFDCIIVSLVNRFIEPGLKNRLLGIVILLTVSIAAYALSYPLTVRIFKRREY